jgi:hypothetical protein
MRSGTEKIRRDERRMVSFSVRQTYAACPLRSTGRDPLLRFGSSSGPKTRMITIVQANRGTPTIDHSKNRIAPAPANSPAFDTMTFTGLPSSVSFAPVRHAIDTCIIN